MILQSPTFSTGKQLGVMDLLVLVLVNTAEAICWMWRIPLYLGVVEVRWNSCRFFSGSVLGNRVSQT